MCILPSANRVWLYHSTLPLFWLNPSFFNNINYIFFITDLINYTGLNLVWAVPLWLLHTLCYTKCTCQNKNSEQLLVCTHIVDTNQPSGKTCWKIHVLHMPKCHNKDVGNCCMTANHTACNFCNSKQCCLFDIEG